jgi:hypothetical protein
MIGICTKCKLHRKVVMHHAHGYEEDNKDNVKPYCHSCHRKIHNEARKNGRCTIPVKELAKLSWNSSHRRRRKEQRKVIEFNEVLMECVSLFEMIEVWPKTIHCSNYFHANNGKSLKYVDIE